MRLRRRARRLARGGVVALAALTAAATVASVVAVQQADQARARAAEAEARSSALAALDLPISRLDEAFVASLRAAGRDADNPDRFRSAQTLVGRYPRLSQLLPVEAPTSPAVVSELAVSAAGQVGVDVLTIADGGAAHTLVRPQVANAVPVDVGDSIFVSYLAESSRIVTVDGVGGATVIDEDGTRRAVDGEVGALDSGNDRAVVTRGDRQMLIVVSTGEEVADLGAVNGGIWPLFTRDVVVAWSPGRLALFDAVDGELLATGATTVDPVALYVTPSGSVAATIEGPSGAPVLRRWERAGERTYRLGGHRSDSSSRVLRRHLGAVRRPVRCVRRCRARRHRHRVGRGGRPAARDAGALRQLRPVHRHRGKPPHRVGRRDR